MKRILACLMALFMLLNVCAAEPLSDDALLILAELMAENVDLAAASDVWKDFMTTSDEARELIDTWAAGEHKNPLAVYRIVLDADEMASIANVDSLPPVLSAMFVQRLVVTAVTQLNAAYGAAAMAAATASAINTGFAGTVDPCIYVLEFAQGADVAVCFYPFDGGTSGAYATFLPDDFAKYHLKVWIEEGDTVERVR